MKQPTKTELPIKALLSLERAVDHGTFFTYSTGIRHAGWYETRKLPTTEDPTAAKDVGAPEINSSTYESLRVRGCLEHLEHHAFEARFGLHKRRDFITGKPDPKQEQPVSPLGWNERASLVNDVGRALLEASRGRLAKWREDEAARSEEFVVVRRRGKPGPGAYCKVEKRTEKRVYLADIDGGDMRDATALIQGGNSYVDLDDVYADDMDKSSWLRLVPIVQDRDARASGIRDDFDKEYKDLVRRREDRLKQLDAMMEDEMREALEAKAAGPR